MAVILIVFDTLEYGFGGRGFESSIFSYHTANHGGCNKKCH